MLIYIYYSNIVTNTLFELGLTYFFLSADGLEKLKQRNFELELDVDWFKTNSYEITNGTANDSGETINDSLSDSSDNLFVNPSLSTSRSFRSVNNSTMDYLNEITTPVSSNASYSFGNPMLSNLRTLSRPPVNNGIMDYLSRNDDDDLMDEIAPESSDFHAPNIFPTASTASTDINDENVRDEIITLINNLPARELPEILRSLRDIPSPRALFG